MNRRHGVILVAVLVVVILAILAATSTVARAGAELSAAHSSLRTTRARAGAWSGVEAAMAELATQRDAMLVGDPPVVTESWILGEHTSAPVRVRFMPLGEHTLESESAKLNLNTATREMLARLPGLDDASAGAILAARSPRFASVEDLERIAALPRDFLDNGSSAAIENPASDPGPDRSELAFSPRAWLTAASFDPNVQSGLGERGLDQTGVRRINLNLAWSDSLARAIDDRFGDGVSAAVKPFFEQKEDFTSRKALVEFLRRRTIPPEIWGEVLDAFTTEGKPFAHGRVDVNLAPAEVLACMDGITPEAAAEIVARRSGLDALQRRSIAWPVQTGILSPEDFALACEHLTTRSLQWRVLIEAGVVVVTDEGEETIQDRCVLEAVIDVSSRRPRVAYLREVTMKDAARRVAEARRAAAQVSDPEEVEANEASQSPDHNTNEIESRSRQPDRMPDGMLDEPPTEPDPSEPGPPMEEATPESSLDGEDDRTGRWTTGGPR